MDFKDTKSLAWKEFNVNLAAVEAKIKADNPSCVGNLAVGSTENNPGSLTFYFTEVLTEEAKTAIQAYWDAVTAESIEATGYKSQTAIDADVLEVKTAVDLLEAGLVSKSWDAMSAVERMIVLGLEITKQDLV